MSDVMMGSINLFEMFGIDEPKQDSSEVKKGTKAKKPVTAKKSASIEYKLPFEVISAYYEPLVIREAPEEQKVDEAYIKSVIAEQLPEYTDKLMHFVRKDASNGYVLLESNKSLSKGTVHLTKESRIMISGTAYDLSSIMTDETCDVDVKEVQKFVTSTYPLMGEQCKLYVDGQLIVARPELPKVENLEFPVKISFFNRSEFDFEVDESAYTAFAEKNNLKMSLTADGEKKPEEHILKKMAAEKSKEYGDRMTLGCYQDRETSEKTCVVYFSNQVVAASTGKTEEMYPTKDVTLSIVFKRFSLTSEMFGGASEVSKGELIKFLSKDYPEYSKERTEFVYDKKEKLITAMLKGSKKGAGELISNLEQENLERREYSLAYPEYNGIPHRQEIFPYAEFLVSSDSTVGSFHLFLPKIPGKIFSMAEAFFAYVAERYNTEAMLQIFWNRSKRKYELYCPLQQVNVASLTCERDCAREMENWLIMDLHSHGKIGCSFSSVDDEDEKGTRLYGVFYGYDHDAGFRGFDLRAGCGGLFLPLLEQDVFESHEVLDYRRLDFSEWDLCLSTSQRTDFDFQTEEDMFLRNPATILHGRLTSMDGAGCVNSANTQ